MGLGRKRRQVEEMHTSIMLPFHAKEMPVIYFQLPCKEFPHSYKVQEKDYVGDRRPRKIHENKIILNGIYLIKFDLWLDDLGDCQNV